MKGKKINFNIKNLILMIVSSLMLVVVSVCWFVIANRNSVEGFTAEVDNPSSNADFYEAVDLNMNGVIDNGETYELIKDTSINTRNMEPGQTFFYKVSVRNSHANSNFQMRFNNISDIDGMAEQLLVNAKIVDSSGVVKASTGDNNVLSSLLETSDGSIFDAVLLTGTKFAVGNYEVFYSLKLKNDTTSTVEGKLLTIDDVVVAFVE